ncbi:MAG: ATP-dependent DNA ligase [Myxococcales bacterium]|nr:ATP-dependent DNA ligase [Myxococcales bacterium]
MLLERVVGTWETVRDTRSRTRKREALAACLRDAGPDLPTVACWLAGTLRQGRIGIGPSTVQTAWRELHQPAATGGLSVPDVDAVFDRILAEGGPGSNARRLAELQRLLGTVRENERLFLVRLLNGELRQGATEGLLLDAIAEASGIRLQRVQRAFMLVGDLPRVATTALTRGETGLDTFRIELFRPLRPMLAQTAESPVQAMVLLGQDAFVDHKLDGVRLQIHRDGSQIRTYTRNLHDVTSMVPDVVEAASRLPWARFIVDAEAISLHPDGRPRPFQTTMRRFGRKVDVASLRYEVPLALQVFDCLLLGDDETIDWAAERRFRELMQVPARYRIARTRVSDPDEAEAAYDAATDLGHEGVMVKDPQGIYQAGARGRSWLKVKPTHTLDLLVLGAEWGSGRREGTLSNLHLGAIDPATGEPVMVGKTFKGLTDELLAWQTTALLELETGRNDWQVFVRPELVVEIAFNDVQASSQYPGGMALRFARVKRYRPDKRPEDADALDAVRALLPVDSASSAS